MSCNFAWGSTPFIYSFVDGPLLGLWLRHICLGWAIRWTVGYDFVWCKWVLLGLCRVYVSQRRWPDELWASNVQDEGHAQGRQRRSHVWGQLQCGQVFKGQQHATCRQWRKLGLELSIAYGHNCKACLLISSFLSSDCGLFSLYT